NVVILGVQLALSHGTVLAVAALLPLLMALVLGRTTIRSLWQSALRSRRPVPVIVSSYAGRAFGTAARVRPQDGSLAQLPSRAPPTFNPLQRTVPDLLRQQRSE